MIIRINNPLLTGNELTYLSADAAIGDTSLTVQNTEGWSANNHIVIGRYGVEQAELRKISSTSGANTITVSAALSFAHSIDTPISFIRYNQYQIHRATSKTGAYSQVGSNTDIEVDSEFSEFEDTSGSSTHWYKFRFYNSVDATYSDYSDPVQGTGYTDDSVKAIMDRIYIIGGDPDRQIITETEMMTVLNDGYRIAIAKVRKENPLFYLKHGYVDIKNSYDTGTISITDGATSVSGSGTTWDTGWSGWRLRVDTEGYEYQVTSFTATNAATLAQAYNGAGSNLSSASYKVFKTEYDVYDESDTSNILTDIHRIHQVIDEDGSLVNPSDPKKPEPGYYIKRIGSSIKFCLNFIPGSNNSAGKWAVDYIYQPSRLDSMGDVPELPIGFDGTLQSYGLWRLKERMKEESAAAGYQSDFIQDLNNMVRRGTNRGDRAKKFRLPSRYDHSQRRFRTDADWWDQKWGV